VRVVQQSCQNGLALRNQVLPTSPRRLESPLVVVRVDLCEFPSKREQVSGMQVLLVLERLKGMLHVVELVLERAKGLTHLECGQGRQKRGCE
jgi:hypothetical protein